MSLELNKDVLANLDATYQSVTTWSSPAERPIDNERTATDIYSYVMPALAREAADQMGAPLLTRPSIATRRSGRRA